MENLANQDPIPFITSHIALSSGLKLSTVSWHWDQDSLKARTPIMFTRADLGRAGPRSWPEQWAPFQQRVMGVQHHLLLNPFYRWGDWALRVEWLASDPTGSPSSGARIEQSFLKCKGLFCLPKLKCSRRKVHRQSKRWLADNRAVCPDTAWEVSFYLFTVFWNNLIGYKLITRLS